MAWTGGSGVALVTEGLTGRGRAVLQRAIRRAGWSDGQFWVCQAGDIPAGARALVAMGAGPLKALTGFEGGKRAVEYVRGYELPSWTGLPVVPTFDPEKVAMGQMKLLGLVMNDVGLALRAARKPNPVLDPKAMVDAKVGLQALRDLYAEARANPQLCIAADLETKESSEADEDDIMEFSRDEEDDEVPPEDGLEDVFEQGSLDVQRADITTVQFSLRPMTGVSCDWSDEAAQLTQAFMDLPNEIAFQNGWHFDEPILRNHGIRIPETTHDTRWMAHCLQPDLPKHLQGIASWFSWPFPWKHFAGSDLAFYGVIDVAVVQHLMIHLPRALKQLGLWDAYLRYVKEFRPVLADMERRGIPVNREKLGELRGWLDTEVRRMDGDLQLQVPPHLIGCSPVKGYDNLPQEIKPIVTSLHADLLAPTVKQLKNGKTKEVASKVKGQDLYRMLVTGELPNSTLELCLAQGFEIKEFNGQGRRLYKRVDFNARSPKQIVEYIKARNWPVPTRFKDGKDTTGDKELAKLEARTKDASLGLIRSIRAYSKMGNAYAGKIGEDGEVVGGWQPGPDGRLRATFTFGPATWQLAARNPNVLTTPKRRKELAKKFRKCIEAPPGYKLVSFDFKSFHALTTALEARDPLLMRLSAIDVHSFLAGHLVKYPGIETCTTMSDVDLTEYLDEIKKAHLNVREFQAKPCIAEGQLVLTDKGLIPIETITLEHKLWDGIEWVQHEGVICKGIKETIEYEGLRATPDHEVFTQSGWKVSFWKAAQEMERLESTGATGQAVRTRQNHFRELEKDKGVYPFILSMSDLQKKMLGLQEQPSEWQDYGLSEMLDEDFEKFVCNWTAVRFDTATMYKSNEPRLHRLRWPGSTIELLVPEGVHFMGGKESPSRKLPGHGVRPDQQRGALRAGESEVSNSTRADTEYKSQCENDFSGERNSNVSLRQSLRSIVDSPTDNERNDWRGDNSSSPYCQGKKGKRLEELRATVKRVRVYDIINAGPRHRFTVSGKLVANCVHGTNFGQSARRMYFEYSEHFANEAAAHRLLDLYKALFPKLFQWQERVCNEADARGYLISRWGAIRRFWDVKKWTMRDGRWKSTLGKDAEKVKAFFPSNDAHGMFRDKVLQCYERGWTDRYGLVNLIHDDTLWVCPDELVEECIANVRPLLQAPVPQLADEVMCPDGFQCGVDASVGSDWASMEEVK